MRAVNAVQSAGSGSVAAAVKGAAQRCGQRSLVVKRHSGGGVSPACGATAKAAWENGAGRQEPQRGEKRQRAAGKAQPQQAVVKRERKAARRAGGRRVATRSARLPAASPLPGAACPRRSRCRCERRRAQPGSAPRWQPGGAARHAIRRCAYSQSLLL